MYDYLLGGKDNFEADRAAAEAGIALFPKSRESARGPRLPGAGRRSGVPDRLRGLRLRDHAEVSRFFDGLDLVEPGVVQISQWRPRSELEARAHGALWGGVARKPG